MGLNTRMSVKENQLKGKRPVGAVHARASRADRSMFDDVDPARRRLMSRVRDKNTAPEMRVRLVAHALGYRYRLHRADLPGSPDLVFPSRRAVIFVHGCFWHRHEGCRKTTTPKTHTDFWNAKFRANVARDRATSERLLEKGWKELVIWECQTSDLQQIAARIRCFLDPRAN